MARRKYRRLPEGKKEEIERLYSKGNSVLDITRQLGLNYAHVNYYARLRYSGRKQKSLAALAEEKGFDSAQKYREFIAKREGYSSYAYYLKSLRKKHAKKPEYRNLGKEITSRLKELEKSRAWLARQTDLSKQVVSLYARGEVMPGPEAMQKIRAALYPALLEERV